MTNVKKKSNKRTRSPEKIRRNKSKYNTAYIFYWFLILIFVGRIDTDYGNSPNNDLIYTGIYLLFTIIYLVIKVNKS